MTLFSQWSIVVEDMEEVQAIVAQSTEDMVSFK